MVSADSVYNMSSAANCRTSASREVLSTRGTEKPECAHTDASAQSIKIPVAKSRMMQWSVRSLYAVDSVPYEMHVFFFVLLQEISIADATVSDVMVSGEFYAIGVSSSFHM